MFNQHDILPFELLTLNIKPLLREQTQTQFQIIILEIFIRNHGLTSQADI